VWLRCIEARVVEGSPAQDTAPVLYLGGISREKLRAAEDCPPELSALVELQYRGAMWLHANGKDWTPYAFLVSKHGGLGLDVARDAGTLAALAGALPALLSEPLSQLKDRHLDAEFFNGLVAPDAAGLLLRWLSAPDKFREARNEAAWRAFCEQCKKEFHLDPMKDGPLAGAKLLAGRKDSWRMAWQRFADAPGNYVGLVEWLRRAAPAAPSMFDTAEVWPTINEDDERRLQKALEALADRPQGEVIAKVLGLEAQHGKRRDHPWQKLGLSPMATALEPLARLSALCQTAPGAADPAAYASYYADQGWRVDAAALDAMAAGGAVEQSNAFVGLARAVYLPWLDAAARHLQKLVHDNGQGVSKRTKPVDNAPGRLVMFADGLRMDVAHRLADKLASMGVQSSMDWEWSTIPTVTASAKPAASPLAGALKGADAGDAFCARLAATGQLLTQERFVSALEGTGWQVLGPDATGDPKGSAWTEAGTLDKRGHSEGWKLARSVEAEIRDLATRIVALLKAGWTELIVVTDHGWLLMPGGLPKVELKVFLTETRWARCAELKPGASTDGHTFKWTWNPAVMMASPVGAGAYRAGTEYSHGGVSLQELVTPVLRVGAGKPTSAGARLVEAKWTKAKCRVSVSGNHQGLRVDVRTNAGEPGASLLSDKLAREIGPEGKVTVFLEDDANIGSKAEVVLLDQSGQVIDSLATTVGE
jgi:hypothetical protein